MSSDTLIAALVGAVFGGLASFVAQSISDRSRERARAREAAAMLRGELLRGLTAVALLLTAAKKKHLKRGDLSGHSLLTPAGVYFDRLGLLLASNMPFDWFVNVMAVYARWTAIMRIARALEETNKLADSDRKFLEDWARDADVAQELLLLVAQRWRPRRQFGRLERELRTYLAAHDLESGRAFSSSEVAAYFRFYQFRRGK